MVARQMVADSAIAGHVLESISFMDSELATGQF